MDGALPSVHSSAQLHGKKKLLARALAGQVEEGGGQRTMEVTDVAGLILERAPPAAQWRLEVLWSPLLGKDVGWVVTAREAGHLDPSTLQRRELLPLKMEAMEDTLEAMYASMQEDEEEHEEVAQAMAVVRNLPDPAGSAKVVAAPSQPGQETKAPATLEGKNVNMALNEIAMCNGCVPEWTMVGEQGMPHQKTFTWQLTLGEFTTRGTGPNKKLARNVAAEQMMALLPEEWKQGRKGKGSKRPSQASRGGPSPKKKVDDDGKVVITADNPVSCLYEYTKKVKIPDPEFTCVSETVLETWQKANQTFKKIEYTIELKIEDKTYLASSNQKKAAKTACAAEAWNAIRATLI